MVRSTQFDVIICDLIVQICRPGQAMCLQIEDTLFEGSSEFQNVAIFTTKTYGRLMTIDGCIQSTERDEFAYHEMMAHVPLFCHPDPHDVCIIGGGDGGVLREVLRHDCVKSGSLPPVLRRQQRHPYPLYRRPALLAGSAQISTRWQYCAHVRTCCTSDIVQSDITGLATYISSKLRR